MAAAEEPNHQMSLEQCASVAQFLWWIPDYRDVKADKDILKARVKEAPKWARDVIEAEVDRIWATNETAEEAVRKWMASCTAVRS